MRVEFANIEINLTCNKAYEWQRYENIFIKGIIHNKSEVLKNLARATSGSDLARVFSTINGFYAAIVLLNHHLYAFTDQMRSFPIFYKLVDGCVIEIFDRIDIERTQKEGIDSEILHNFIGESFVPGNSTLAIHIYQIGAGHYVEVSEKGSLSDITYWEIKYSDRLISDSKEASLLIKRMYEEVFDSVVSDLCPSHQIIIPLSGGHDSRLIAYSLVKRGVKNIIAYSYGDVNSTESKLSKAVAERLCIEYHFIKYSKIEGFTGKGLLRNYINYAANASSVPCVQELFALAALKKMGVITSNALVFPGFGGVITGHYIHEKFVRQPMVSLDEVVRMIQENFFDKKRVDADYIWNYLGYEKNGSNEYVTSQSASELFEKYTFIEEQSKFIQNAVRVYEFFNMKWFTPYFEKQCISTWLAIHPHLRFGDSLYKDYEKDLYKNFFIDIPFTGSKEMKHFYISDEHAKKNGYLHKIIRYANPYSQNYLWVLIPIWHYYYNLLRYKKVDFNYFVQRIYLRALNLKSGDLE